MLESGLFCAFSSNLEVSVHDSDLVLILVDLAFELGILSALFFDLPLELVFQSIVSIDLSFEFQVEFMGSFLELSALMVPVFVLFGLLIDPLLMSTLETGDFCLKLLSFVFVEAVHLLQTQVESLDLLVLVHDLLLQVSLLVHDFFETHCLLLYHVVVRNMSQRSFGSLILVVFLVHGDLISHIGYVSLMDHLVLVDPILVVSAQIYLLLHSICKFLSEVVQHVSEIVSFAIVSSNAVSELGSETLYVCFIELADLDLHELYLSFIVLDDLLNLVLKLLVIGLDLVQSPLLVGLQVTIEI